MNGSHAPDPERTAERGSALVIAVLVSVILALLGISFLMMGETENRIARNEKLAAQALYVAESGARAVKRWFDEPGTAMHFPAVSEVDRSDRRIVDESDPYNPAAVLNPGDSGWVVYKNVGNGIFDRPYRGGPEHSLMGTRDGPDLTIDRNISGHVAFLDGLSQTLYGGLPQERGGVAARISLINVYAPPYVQIGGVWNRYGLGTVLVIAEIYQDLGSGVEVLATREVEAVISEAPYHGPYGPLHSCSDLSYATGGNISVHWGPVTAERGARFIGAPYDDNPYGLPRSVPAAPRLDTLWPTNAADFTTFTAALDGKPIEDPWFRTLNGEAISGAPSGVQPYPPPGTPTVADQSNMFQQLPVVGCPDYDYDVWKSFATSGERDVHYYVWSGGDRFSENGKGPAKAFHEIVNDEVGVYFFDTRDGLSPYDNDGNGRFDNLTPEIVVPSGSWTFRGVAFLNSERIKIENAVSDSMSVALPGEPFLDLDADGARDSGEPWVNLDYPTTAGSLNAPILADLADGYGGSAMWNARGPTIPGVPVAFHGILYTNGSFEATGSGTFYGSVIARQGVVQEVTDGSAPTPEIYWDESILTGWPPTGLAIPRTTVTAWITER